MLKRLSLALIHRTLLDISFIHAKGRMNWDNGKEQDATMNFSSFTNVLRRGGQVFLFQPFLRKKRLETKTWSSLTRGGFILRDSWRNCLLSTSFWTLKNLKHSLDHKVMLINYYPTWQRSKLLILWLEWGQLWRLTKRCMIHSRKTSLTGSARSSSTSQSKSCQF